MLWDLSSTKAEQYYTAWSTLVKLCWHVPRATHRYFVDNLLGCSFTSVKADILARYSTFIKNLLASPSVEVATMVSVARQDIRSTTSVNLKLISSLTGLDPLKCSKWKLKQALAETIVAVPVPVYLWTVCVCHE